jgi:hypothetical protein
MAKRVSKRRLYNLSKTGISSGSLVPGSGMSGSYASNSIFRDGALITTEIQINLASSVASASLCSAGTLNAVIGTSGSAAGVLVANAAQLGQLSRANNGIITSVECICTELPVGGTLDINFALSTTLADAAVGYSGSLTIAETIITSTGSWAEGEYESTTYDADELDDGYLYMVAGKATDGVGGSEYSAGKFVLRLYGYAVAADL